MFRITTSFLLLSIFFLSCASKQDTTTSDIERIDPGLDSIIDQEFRIEIIAEGLEWSEGPLWLEEEKQLLFSDVPANAIYKWTEDKGMELYLSPSGYTKTVKRGGEMGSNGLLLNHERKLVLCQHGNRQMAMMNADLNDPKPSFTSIADNYQGKKFNSPNDAVFNKKGELFFTDPPYGLEKNMNDLGKEIPFQGIYKVTKQGNVVLLTDSITRPNGIALTPDEKHLIVSNSDPQKPFWYIFELGQGDSLESGRIFYDATNASKQEPGMPDGLKIDKKGNIFATGPGGIWILDKNATLLGKIKYPQFTSNCALADDEKTLYVTADNHILKIRLRK